ncbi:MAG: hypothetical protein M3410_07000 [Acidobacteriota bacterium]|nr:hypothetical protein [Acidobacteriota bacterium]
MKQTENDEMEVLLRGLARRNGAGAPAVHSAMHLDADELNSYAEQVLPVAARVRYTSHLAECASCRKIVSDLTSASGASVTEQSAAHKTPAGFWRKFGALFSPGLLRYAVPALALIGFIAVGLVVLRNKRQPDFVARNQPAASHDATTETTQSDLRADSGESAASIEEQESQTSAVQGRDNQAKTGERTETSGITTSTDSVTVTSDKDAAPGKAAVVVAEPSYAPEPTPLPPTKPLTTHTGSQTEVARQKEEAEKRDEPSREQEGYRARTDERQNQVAAAPAGKLESGQSQERLRTLEARRASGSGAKTNDEDADTRTVSGRRFRRQGSVWIDTAYQSSTATITLTRGSEQFRALVADEPGVRAIAAQLAGEVVVVWKGRAYRIR